MVNNELEFNNSTFSNNSNTFSASVTNNLNDLEVSAQNTNLALASFVSDGNSSNNSSECKVLSSENNDSKVANSSLTLEENVSTNSLEEEILFLTDYIIDRFQKQQSLLKFLSKNLSWGVFQDAVGTGSVVSRQFYDHYRNSLIKYNVNCGNPDLLLFTLIELISSTSYNCILHEKPVSMEEYKPYLHKSLKKVYEVFVSVQD